VAARHEERMETRATRRVLPGLGLTRAIRSLISIDRTDPLSTILLTTAHGQARFWHVVYRRA